MIERLCKWARNHLEYVWLTVIVVVFAVYIGWYVVEWWARIAIIRG